MSLLLLFYPPGAAAIPPIFIDADGNVFSSPTTGGIQSEDSGNIYSAGITQKIQSQDEGVVITSAPLKKEI